MRFARFSLGLGLLLPLLAGTDANAALITFDTRTAFNLASPGLPLEDFEEANVAPGGVELFIGPLSSSTNNAVFSTGEILAGLTVESAFDPTVQSVPNPELVAVGGGFIAIGNPSIAVGPNALASNSNLLFTNASAVGFDLFTNRPGSPVAFVSLFGVGDALLGSFCVLVSRASPAFFGAIDTENLITRINVDMAPAGSGEVFDNIAFGAPVPEPGTLLLIGSGLLAVVARRRLQKRSS